MKYNIRGHDVYWLNRFVCIIIIIGLQYVEPPVLVWIDYIQVMRDSGEI